MFFTVQLLLRIIWGEGICAVSGHSFNPLIPRRDQYVNSPHTFNEISVRHVLRMKIIITLRTLARKFSNIDFFLQILPLKDDELVMPEM